MTLSVRDAGAPRGWLAAALLLLLLAPVPGRAQGPGAWWACTDVPAASAEDPTAGLCVDPPGLDRNAPAFAARKEGGRNARHAPRGPLPLTLGGTDLGLLRPACPSPFLAVMVQGVRVQDASGVRTAVATTLRSAVRFGGASDGVGPEVFFSLGTRPLDSGGGAAALAAASLGVGYGVSDAERRWYALPFLRVHLPPSFAPDAQTRLGLEPGLAWEQAPGPEWTAHAGLTAPWLLGASRDGSGRGAFLSPTVGVTWRSLRTWRVLSFEVRSQLDAHRLRNVSLGAAYRFRLLFLRPELDVLAAVAGAQRGTVTVGFGLSTF